MRFLLGFISATIFIAIMCIVCWLYFDFPISTNDEEKENTAVETSTRSLQENNYTQPTQTTEQKAPATIPSHEKQATEQKHNGITPPNNKTERLNNLHDKQKAVELMRSERHTLSDEDKKIFDGVIETAKTNINNGVATQEDYSYLNMYKKLKGGE